MTDKNNATNPEAHPLPWTAWPADKADLFEGADMWFFNDANGEEVFYGCAMSAEVRDLVLEAVNGTALLSKLSAPVANERAALADLLEYVDRNTCTHEDTHRGGAIWTICDGCGMKWADDEGGFVPHQDAPAVAAARTALASAPVAEPPQLRLSPDVLEYLKEGVENATGCEESDVDYDFANELLRLINGPLYTAAVAGGAYQPSAQSTVKDDKAALGIPECGKPLCAPGEHHPLCRHGWAEKKGVSDPVAGEAMQLLRSIREQDYLSDTMRHRIDRLLTNAAPQASETVDRSPNLQGSQVDESAELQGIASEAVRNARAEGFQAGLDKALEVLEHDDFATRMQSAQVIRSLKSQSAALSAQPGAEPLSNPKQFPLTAADERTAFEATYQADYDDPGAACEREHFGKGYRAGLAAQSGAQLSGKREQASGPSHCRDKGHE